MPGIRSSSALLSSMTTGSENSSSTRRIITHAASQNIRAYGSNQEYLHAMREDLADWLKGLYAVDIKTDNFFSMLETGTLLCQHANNITTCAEYIRKNNVKVDWKYVKFPSKFLLFNQGKFVRASSFFARDNVASFIGWCRSELMIPESVMFETNDLVLRHNEKNVILCLLEVARRGSKFGVPAPVLIQMEEDIDKEIEMDKKAKEQNATPPEPIQQRVTCDFKSLDEMVQHILGMCTCPNQFPMVRVSDGKYKVGDSENLIFMRILRQHVMVRVGGGWDTLEHYLNKHDPCRCRKHKTDRTLTPRHSRSQSASTRPSLQQQHSLPSPATSLKSSPNNKRLVGGSRLAKSTNNLSDLSPTGKSDRLANRRSPAARSRNSSASDTPSSDTRPSRPKLSVAPEQNPKKLAPSSTNNNKERTTRGTEDVFTRLSRCKSTPPVTCNASVEQDDLLLVQRTNKGNHRVQRTTIAGSYTPRSTPINKANATSSDKVHPRSKSVMAPNSTSRPVRQSLDSKTPRQSTFSKTPRSTTPSQTPRQSTFSKTPRQTTPSQTSRQSTLSKTPRQTTPTQTSRQSTFSKTPRQTTPSQTSRQSTLSKTPRQTTPSQTSRQSTLSKTPRQTTPSQTSRQSTFSKTPRQTTPSQTPTQSALSKTPRSAAESKTPRRSGAEPKTPRPKSACFMTARERKTQSRPSTTLTPKATELSIYKPVDDKEREILEAFEKECLSNQHSLQLEQLEQRRRSSTESSNDKPRRLSHSSAEDNEVAMHMQQSVDRSNSRPSHPPSAFHSLPRPRKDKVDKHEHPTRIPTPVSFARPQLSEKSERSHEDGENTTKSTAIANDVENSAKPLEALEKLLKSTTLANNFEKTERPREDVKEAPKSTTVANNVDRFRPASAEPKAEDRKVLPNGGASDAPVRPLQPRIDLAEINRLLNSQRSSVVNRRRPESRGTRAIISTFSNADPTPLRSSGVPTSGTSNDKLSAFDRVVARNGDTMRESFDPSSFRHHLKQQHSPPCSYPSYRGRSPFSSVELDLNENVTGLNGNVKPGNIYHPPGLKSSSFVEPKIVQNGVGPELTNVSDDVQWV